MRKNRNEKYFEKNYYKKLLTYDENIAYLFYPFQLDLVLLTPMSLIMIKLLHITQGKHFL